MEQADRREVWNRKRRALGAGRWGKKQVETKREAEEEEEEEGWVDGWMDGWIDG